MPARGGRAASGLRRRVGPREGGVGSTSTMPTTVASLSFTASVEVAWVQLILAASLRE